MMYHLWRVRIRIRMSRAAVGRGELTRPIVIVDGPVIYIPR